MYSHEIPATPEILSAQIDRLQARLEEIEADIAAREADGYLDFVPFWRVRSVAVAAELADARHTLANWDALTAYRRRSPAPAPTPDAPMASAPALIVQPDDSSFPTPHEKLYARKNAWREPVARVRELMSLPREKNSIRGAHRVVLAATVLAAGSAHAVPAKVSDAKVKTKAKSSAKAKAKTGVVKAAPAKRDLSKGNNLFVVPYAHLDTQWRWAYPQVIREFIASTLTKNFDLIDRYPSYVFNFSGSRRYEMMREYYPADYEKLKGYIKAGRWFPCGSSVDEGDANVPSAESLVRHVLYGNRYFRHEFGVASQEFMLPDCFGFPYALPSILNYCGIQGFSTQKLTWGSAVGIPFKVGTWEGPDGKSIVAALDPGAYSGDVREDLSQNTSWLARIQNTGKQSGAYVDYHYYGTGDRGGSPTEDSVKWVDQSTKGKGPVTVISSRADEMFTALKPEQISKLPHYKGELLLTEHSAGSITSQAYMKRWNRKSELLADAAERASVAAMWLGGAPYPADRLYTNWDLVLGSQMHDMLPGTSIPKAYEYCWNDYLLAQNGFASIENDAVGAVTAAMDTTAQGRALVVYNPLSTDRQDVVEATLKGFGGGGVVVYGPDDRPVPTQVIGRDGDDVKVIFVAKVPSMGFATYDARPSAVTTGTTLSVKDRTLENERYRVTVNEAGDVASVYDKANSREILKAPSRLEFQYHNPSQFPAWNMDWDQAKLPPQEVVTGPAKITVVENGPVRVALQVEREAMGSKFVQTIRLTTGGDRVEVANQIDWQTRERALKVSFPLASGNPEATYDLQLGAIQRGNNDPKKYEVPQHQWLDLTKADDSFGAAILNDGKFGSDKPDDDTVRLTLLYTPGVRGGYTDQATQDFGRHDVLYAIAPHSGDWRQGNVAWNAKRMNQPLVAFAAPSHSGRLGRSFSLMSSSTGQVEISAVKKAEDGNEVVVRLRELTGKPATGVQIRAATGIASAREVNGQEQPMGKAMVSNGALVTDVPGFALRSFAIKLGNAPTRVAAKSSRPVALEFDTDVASTNGNPADGAFGSDGMSIAAEMLPGSMNVDGVDFKLGSGKDGEKNAVIARGQTINLPAGYSRVYVIAAADGDVPATFNVGDKSVSATVENWSGYVGSWDNRIWKGDLGPNFTNYGDMIGLKPGYVKKGEVAWYASHRHDPKAGNTYYDYSYLYKLGFDVPTGATTMTLPNDPRVRVFAVSVAKDAHDDVMPVQPLYDTLADHRESGMPTIVPATEGLSDAVAVDVMPPLYRRPGGLRYTTDGSEPTASSPEVNGPIMLNDPTTLKVAEIDENGKVGPVATATVNVHDTTAPKVVEVTSPKALGIVRVRFSERVTPDTASNPANYTFSSSAKVASAKVSPDGQSVELTLDKPLPSGSSDTVTVKGVKDMAQAGNTLPSQTVTIAERGAIFTSPELAPKTSKAFTVQNLPVKAGMPWTLNLFCKIDGQPEDRTVIAGFGRPIDGREGTGRYFTKFSEGINFWVADRDVSTNVPLDLGKWQMLTATYDGVTMRLYKNGEPIAEQKVELADDQPRVNVMPLDAWERKRLFGGEVRDLTVWDGDLSPAAVKRLWESSTH